MFRLHMYVILILTYLLRFLKFSVNLGFLGPRAWEFAKRRVEALLIYSLQNDGDTTVEIRREAEGRHYAAYVFVAGKLLTEIMQTLYR